MRNETVLSIHLNVKSDVAKMIQGIQKKFGLVYSGNYQYKPHITIYLAKYKQSDFVILQKRIIQAELQPIRLTITGLCEAPHHNGVYFSLGINEKPELMRFSRKIVGIANQLRGNRIRSKDIQRIRKKMYSPSEIEAIRKYGYIHVGNRFHPHVTLGSVAAQHKHISRIQTEARTLRGKSFVANEVIIGLYAYDKLLNNYTKVIREHIISLGA